MIPTIPSLHDPVLEAALQARIDGKTKPLGALGRLETLMLRLGLILGSETPQLREPQMMVFAADHDLAARGVSAYPSDVTWQMVENFLAGGAAVSVLARQHGLQLTVVDAGVAHDFAPRQGLVVAKIAPGTADASSGPAMSAEQCAAAIAAGKNLLAKRPGNVLLLGEMGIGNTSAAALLLARLGKLPIAQCTGRGTGLDDVQLQRKTEILRQVLQRHGEADTPLAALAAFGGFEIAMMVGAILQAALERRVIVVDGFIVGSAVLVAAQLQPAVLERCVFAHASNESGHNLMLETLGAMTGRSQVDPSPAGSLARSDRSGGLMSAEPLLDLGLRLGEGSGAALAWPLLQSAARILTEMASFTSAGVSEKQ